MPLTSAAVDSSVPTSKTALTSLLSISADLKTQTVTGQLCRLRTENAQSGSSENAQNNIAQ